MVVGTQNANLKTNISFAVSLLQEILQSATF